MWLLPPHGQPMMLACLAPKTASCKTLLLARGHDIGQPDGLIGAKTRQAIRAEQGRLGMPVNGRGGQKLLGALRSK